MFVHLPVHAAEGFPTTVEVEGIGQIGICLSKITEAEPYAQVGSDVVAGIYFSKYLRDFFHNVAVGIQVGHSFKGGLDEIVVISRLLVSEQGVQVETFERIDFCRSSPAQGLDVVY